MTGKNEILIRKSSINDPVSKEKNKIFQLLSSKERNLSTLNELNNLLKTDASIALLNLNDPSIDGSLLHFLTQTAQATDDVSWRMVYALSNAGIDVNLQNSKGNTALHLAYMRGYTEIGFEFIEALLKVGTDLSLKNKNNKIAFNYMEDIEQLNSMYEAHYPGIWSAVKESNTNDVQRLMNAWVKVNTRKNGLKLMEFARQTCVNNQKIIETLENFSLSSDYVHAVYAIDIKRSIGLLSLIGDKFDPNMADFCYCFSWFKPVCRNIPKFLLEVALDTKQEDLIRNVLSTGCDVNMPNSKNGDPFYFYAFENEFQNVKNELLQNSNFNIKNQRGRNVLFHIVNLFTKNEASNDFKKILLEDFSQIIKKSPLILTHRDQDDLTLMETILTMSPSSYKKCIIFLIEISKFVLKVAQEKNFKIFQEMIYQSYGLILSNTPIFTQEDSCLTFEEYIVKNNLSEMKIYFKKIFDTDFVAIINKFAKAIKIGDLNSLKEFLSTDKNYFLIRIRDYSGRSCLHLAVLYGQAHVVKFFLQQDANLIKGIDNLNRTALHYAFALKDKKIIEILMNYKINKFARDAKFLLAEEYELEEVLNDDWFKVKNFKEVETRKTQAVVSYMKCFQYKKIKETIEKNDIEALKQLNSKLKICELSILDFPYLKSENSFIEGQEYITLLELAMNSRSFSAFRYLLEQMQVIIRLKDRKSESITKSDLIAKKLFERYLYELREKAEDLEIYEIVDILDNADEDKEIAAVTLDSLSTTDLNQTYINNIMAKKAAVKLKINANADYQIRGLNKNIYAFKEADTETDADLTKNSKICSIL